MASVDVYWKNAFYAVVPRALPTKGIESSQDRQDPGQPVTQWWYTQLVATSHPRIQVTEDPELARALRTAAPHLKPGLPRSQQLRELAIAGARQLSDSPESEAERQMLLERLANRFTKPETSGIDWDLLREGKRRAWPIR
jgi:hypothetical protein